MSEPDIYCMDCDEPMFAATDGVERCSDCRRALAAASTPDEAAEEQTPPGTNLES